MTFKLTKRPKQSALQQYEIVQSEVKAALQPIAEQHVSQRNAVIGGWRHKPQFRGVVAVGPKQISVRVLLENATESLGRYGGTIRDLWRWHNEGTGIHGPKGRPYPIFPRFRSVLRFFVAGREIFAKFVNNPEKGTHPGMRGQRHNDKINRRLKRFEQSQIRRGFSAGWKRLRRELR